MKRCVETNKPFRVVIITHYWKGSPGGGVKVYLTNLVDVLKDKNIECIVLFKEGDDPLNIKIEGNKILFAIRAFNFLKKHDFNIIHTHETWYCLLAGVLYKKLVRRKNVKLIHTFHTAPYTPLPLGGSSFLQYLVSNCDIVTYASNGLKENMEKEYGVKTNPSKSRITLNGYKSSLFYPMETLYCKKILNISANCKIILSVGNLLPIKGHRYLIEAIKEIAKNRTDIICYIVGNGYLMKTLQEQINKTKLNNYVRLVGERPYEEIPLWMNACDVFVLPSLEEGNPTVMFECLGCGKPFIGTAVGGIPEIITSDEYGLLCESANPKDLAEKILIALEKEWDREKIIKYAEQFTWDKITENIVGIYRGEGF